MMEVLVLFTDLLFMYTAPKPNREYIAILVGKDTNNLLRWF